jgi:hypothetical protein
MFCCPNCFIDPFLQSVIQAISTIHGTCSFCGKESNALIDPKLLMDRFEPLLGLYQANPMGESLLKLLQDDWNIFQSFSDEFQKELLLQVSGGSYNLEDLYLARFQQDISNLERWENFREELKFCNRFFPTNAPDIDHLTQFGKHIGRKMKIGSEKLYRARVSNTSIPLPLDEMGKPPQGATANGRANPLGISYLYVASDPDTAISEIRPHKGEKVTVAEFKVVQDLELADLGDPKESISPFQLNDDDELELIYKNLPYLTMLGKELSKPIIPQEVNLEYLPSQYLCELIKQIGFHGIIYKSSVGEGSNYVIFNDEKLDITNSSLYEITDTKIISHKLIR